MKFFYSFKNSWEFDFIKNILFDNKFEFEDFNFNNIDYYIANTDLHDNCIIVFSTFYTNAINNMSYIVEKIRPKILILLSDEYGIHSDLIKLHKYTKLVLHNYNHSHYTYYSNCIQLPLGYISGFLKNLSNISDCKSILERKYNCSFVGEIKSDRKEMCDLFVNNMENTFINSVQNTWKIDNLKITPQELYNIYSNSIFVINGRGNSSLDCFRIYEAIVSGAIPVIMSSQKEIENTFNYNGYKPFFIYDDTWEKTLNKCLFLLKNKEVLQTIQNINFKWWNLKIAYIKERINQCL